MQKALLRRYGNRHTPVGKQNWLAQLLIPVAQGKSNPLEGGDRKVLAEHEFAQLRDIVRRRARRRLADHAHREPGAVVARVHLTTKRLHEAVLQLMRAPVFMRGIPIRRKEPGGASDGARIPGPIGQIAREHVALVGGHEDIVGLRALRQRRHLALGLHGAGVAAPAAARVFIDSLLDNLRAEFFRRASIGLCEKLVLRMRALDEQPAAPLLPDQILREPVGEHGARGRDVNNALAAVFLAQPFVRRRDVENQRGFLLRPLARGNQPLGGEIGDDEQRALVDKRVHLGGDVVAVFELRVDRLKSLVGEFAGCIIVGDSQQRAGEHIIRGGNVEDRERLARMRLAKHADFHVQGLRRRGSGDERNGAGGGETLHGA